MSNAGGAAIHSGVDYQQRISAIFLISLYSRFDVSEFLSHTSCLTPKQVSYETSAAVDDLNVACVEGTEVFIQAKRTLSLSDRSTSEFVSVIDQFVRSFIPSPDAEHLYVLITSSSASRRITHDLRKILDSIRHNDTAFESNPLSKQEASVLKTYRDVFSALSKKHNGVEASQAQFMDFSTKVMVQVWDVESGMSLETAAILLLYSKGFGIPQLIWNYLIGQSVHYASQRMSVSHKRIVKALDNFKMTGLSPDEMEPLLNELLRPRLRDVEKMPVGKEVLLVSSFTEEADLILVECFRFDDSGVKRNLIDGPNALLSKGSIRVPIIQRFASREAFARFCEEKPEILKDKKLIQMLSESVQGVEESIAVQKHRKFCVSLLKKNSQLAKCLHSGRSCLTSDAYLVELDSPALPPAVGLVRADELRPLDRIMGVFFHEGNEGKDLPNFDLTAWMAAIPRGQGLVNGVQQMKGHSGRQTVVAWNDANPNTSSYSYCIKFIMEDESFKYCYVRGKIERLPKYEAEARSTYLNETILQMSNKGDAQCLTSENWTFGSRSQLEAVKQPEESILEISRTEVCAYSDILGRTFNRCDNYYAPLCVIRDLQTDQTLTFGGNVPLVSDPFSLKMMMKSWPLDDLGIKDVVLSVLKNDYEFDDFMREVFRDQLTPVIDPIWNDDGTLVSGVLITPFEELAQAAKEAQQ